MGTITLILGILSAIPELLKLVQLIVGLLKKLPKPAQKAYRTEMSQTISDQATTVHIKAEKLSALLTRLSEHVKSLDA